MPMLPPKLHVFLCAIGEFLTAPAHADLAADTIGCAQGSAHVYCTDPTLQNLRIARDEAAHEVVAQIGDAFWESARAHASQVL